MVTAYVGTSGWQYRDWRGRFYPPGLPTSKWLGFYAETFGTVEVNNTFYRLPERETFARWRKALPAGFVVAVKASRYITHVRRLNDVGPSVALLLERAEALGPLLGPILFQLPPRFPVDVERLRACLRSLPQRLRVAFEFRDPSWHVPEVAEALDHHGAALVWPDGPGNRPELPLVGGWAYVRFHRGTRGSNRYTKLRLERWADRLAGLDVPELFLYFNNDPSGAAVHDAQRLRHLLAERGLNVTSSVN